MQKQEHVVFKRTKAKTHEEFHGGAWKVAFADFMIALMALFLVLWILQVVDKDERKAIIAQLQSASVFENSFNYPFDTAQSISPIDLASDSSVPSRHDSNHVVTSFFQGDGDGPESDSLIPGNYDTQEQLAALAKVVENAVRQSSAQGNVNVTVTPQGLRIVLQDDYKQHMFSRGGDELTPFFEDLLLAMSPIFEKVTNPLIISGHTDATLFKHRLSGETNWELSSSRANAARQTLVSGGMPEARVLQVTGMSDRALLNEENPDSSENRRIELFVLTTVAAQVLETFFGNQHDSELQKAREKAEFNQPVIRQTATNKPLSSENA
ncbi:flagellar motor protein MotB [Vibrio sp. B1FLJ16]|uniref:flagellar motor protein MotB n=1 Tax=Vibrio sp. B1FLJ16 TaxID=2751178 RepID=UPI0015F57816|nr:flagellar motor protein MotB [Vibrio sp. B1FLJ16]CAD7821928.1 Membrane MotB of proton-channel complex MotA/MotB [Vibrio sp. B1FLJ16]CAD7823458.1 Membrane MotB of proton-channel complex MotA/MotB [Vibrio sp. B1FLJ16]CAE6947561.1 Membrane MotB of proton-channel complex MotA/MotB [Vibrio sp. B1FLJ16]CAE6951952.1 Membrane MotB of proton-channel complex MotA/MotB [Vibrio sp. B1FLJ16]